MGATGASRNESAEERPASLWRNADFLKMWVGMNVSLLGTHVTALALPLVAVMTLQATPAQMGLLRASGSAAAHVLTACGIQLHGVNLMALRQAITPHRLQGRVNASFRFVNLFAAGLGALAAGWAGGRFGLRPTLALAASGILLHFARLLLSPVRRLREIPAE